MISEETAIIKGMRKIADVFGIDYVKEHKDAPICRRREGDKLLFSCLYEDEDQRPDLKPDYLGWTVYATVEVDLTNGNVNVVDYILPNGEKSNNNFN